MHRGKSRVFSAEGGGWEFPLLLVASFIAGGLGGAGKYAIDNPEWMKALVSYEGLGPNRAVPSRIMVEPCKIALP